MYIYIYIQHLTTLYTTHTFPPPPYIYHHPINVVVNHHPIPSLMQYCITLYISYV